MYGPDEMMDCCGNYADECECESPRVAERETPITLSVTFPCGHSVSVMTGKVLTGNCPACAIGIPEGMTKCEDYPCCGHTDGGGCIPRPEFTSEYWTELDSRLRARGMDDYDIDMYYDRLSEMEY